MPDDDFEQSGFALIPGVLNAAECARLAATVVLASSLSGGTRCLLAEPWCLALANKLRQHPLLSLLLPSRHVAIQCTYFEKSASRNWLVPVHQDLSIPVEKRVDDDRLRGWSMKEGAVFVQPPVEVLEQMLAVRLHLDDCLAQDGPLRVVPGSHRAGVVEPSVAVQARSHELVCPVPQGHALVMRPLILHSSGKSSGTGLRRVLHLLFGPPMLPLGLSWAHAV